MGPVDKDPALTIRVNVPPGWDPYPDHFWWLKARYNPMLGDSPPPSPETVALFQAADQVLDRYPALGNLFEISRLSRSLSIASGGVAVLVGRADDWHQNTLCSPKIAKEIEELRAATSSLTWHNQALAAWLEDLFSSYDALAPCSRCGYYRNRSNLVELDGALLCSQELTLYRGAFRQPHEGDTVTVMKNCHKEQLRDNCNKSWLATTTCPICGKSLATEGEVNKNTDGEVISAICGTCRIELHRPASQVTSRVSAEIMSAIMRLIPGPYNPFIS